MFAGSLLSGGDATTTSVVSAETTEVTVTEVEAESQLDGTTMIGVRTVATTIARDVRPRETGALHPELETRRTTLTAMLSGRWPEHSAR